MVDDKAAVYLNMWRSICLQPKVSFENPTTKIDWKKKKKKTVRLKQADSGSREHKLKSVTRYKELYGHYKKMQKYYWE